MTFGFFLSFAGTLNWPIRLPSMPSSLPMNFPSLGDNIGLLDDFFARRCVRKKRFQQHRRPILRIRSFLSSLSPNLLFYPFCMIRVCPEVFYSWVFIRPRCDLHCHPRLCQTFERLSSFSDAPETSNFSKRVLLSFVRDSFLNPSRVTSAFSGSARVLLRLCPLYMCNFFRAPRSADKMACPCFLTLSHTKGA